MKRNAILLGAGVGLLTLSAVAATYDTVIRHGRVADGAGNPAFFADVAITKGRIVALGDIPGKGQRELDAAGQIVAPGFVDVHTHAEEIDEHPAAENFLHMGVTTVVMGNCGDSKLQIGPFFAALEKQGIAPNIVSLVGHNALRREGMNGSFDRPPTPEEMARMKALLARAMEDGAAGLSTGLIYNPGVFSKTDELVELAKVLTPYQGIYATHQRSESAEIFQSIEEICRIAREARVRAQISHLKLAGPANWHQADKVLAAVEQARASGLDLTQDQYAYTASSTAVSQIIPDWAKEGGREQLVARINDPAAKARMVTEMKATLQRRKSPDYAYAMISSYKANPALNGLNIVEAARKVRGADTLDDQMEMIFEIEKNGGATGVFFGICEEDLQVFMRHPNTMFASDSGIRLPSESVPHPRGYGNNARILARYVRDLKILRLEEALRRMSSLPASTFRLRDRGLVREGQWADLVVFNPDTVQDRSEFKDPHHFSTGFKYVLVNGVPVIEEDKYTGALPGKVLRRGAN